MFTYMMHLARLLDNFGTKTSALLDLCFLSLCHEVACTVEQDLFEDLSVFVFIYHSLNPYQFPSSCRLNHGMMLPQSCFTVGMMVCV